MITPRRTRLVRTADLHGFRAAIAALSRQLDARQARDTVVLVPTRAAADQLRRTLVEAPGGNGPAPALPRLMTREDWYAALAERARPAVPLLSAVERYVLMQAAARKAAEHCAPPFEPRPGLTPSFVRFYDDLLRQRQSVDSFERLLGGDLETSAEFDRGARRLLLQTRFLAAAFRAFERDSAATGRCDEHALRRQLLTGGLARPIAGVVVTLPDQAADADGLWPADFDLLTRIEGLERLDVVATEAVLASGFHERLIDYLPGVDEEPPPPSAAAAPSIAAPGGSGQLHFSRRDREDELREVVRALQSGGAGPDVREANPAAGNAAVVFQRPLPYLYLARQLFPQAGVPFRTRDSFPLAAEPYAAALDLVLEFVRSGCGRNATIALLRSPHFRFEHAGRRPAAGAIDALDLLLQRHGFGRGRQELAALAARCVSAAGEGRSGDSPESEAAPAAAVAAALAGELQQLAAPGPPPAQLELLAAFLRRHAVAAAAPVPAAPRETRARDAVLDGLADLARAHREIDDTPAGFDELAASIRRWIESRTFRPQTGSAGVHLVDARAAVYGRFETVFIVGLVDDEWPPPPQRVVFYPQPLLRTLGWPAERDRLQAARARFGDLLRLAAERVSVSTFALENDMVVIPSMLLEQLAEAGLDVARESPAPDAPVVPDDALLRAPPPADLSDPAREWLALRRRRRHDDRYRGAAGSSRRDTYTTGALEQYLACPFQYFARYELGLEPEPGGESMLAPISRGAILQRLTARFWTAWQADGERAVTPANLDRALERFQALVDDEVRAAPAAERAVLRAWLRGSAAAPGLAEQLCRLELARPADVVDRLVDLQVEDARAVPAGETSRQVGVRGALDRVDLHSDGTFDVVDYKAGRVPPADRALRLAAHARWAERRLAGYRGRQWRVRDAAYVALNDPRLRVPLGGASVDAALAQGETQAAAVLEQIGRGAYPVRPAGRHLCATCAYSAVCRKEYAGEQ